MKPLKIDQEDKIKFNIKNYYIQNGHIYISRKISGKFKMLRLSRLIMNCPKGMEVDHINRNKLDNRRENLRIVTHQQNNFNRGSEKQSTSVYKGVNFLPKRQSWRAQIGKDYKQTQIGEFKKERWAAMAYDIAAKDLYGEYANLNFSEIIIKNPL